MLSKMELFGKSTLLIKTMLLRQTEEIPICFRGNLKKNHTSDHFFNGNLKKKHTSDHF